MTTQKQNGVVEPSNGKESAGTIESREKENKEQNHCQEDSDEHTETSEKKKKGKLNRSQGKGSGQIPSCFFHNCFLLMVAEGYVCVNDISSVLQ